MANVNERPMPRGQRRCRRLAATPLSTTAEKRAKKRGTRCGTRGEPPPYFWHCGVIDLSASVLGRFRAHFLSGKVGRRYIYAILRADSDAKKIKCGLRCHVAAHWSLLLSRASPSPSAEMRFWPPSAP